MQRGNPPTRLVLLPSMYWVCRTNQRDAADEKALAIIHDISGTTTIVSVTRQDECLGPYRVLATGVLDPGLVGFLARILSVIASTNVPVMTYSSYERDYILVPSKSIDSVVNALRRKGYDIVKES